MFLKSLLVDRCLELVYVPKHSHNAYGSSNLAVMSMLYKIYYSHNDNIFELI